MPISSPATASAITKYIAVASPRFVSLIYIFFQIKVYAIKSAVSCRTFYKQGKQETV